MSWRWKADFFPWTSGETVDANVTKVLGTAPTEGAAGRLAAALTKFGDVATPVMTAETVNQSGDSYAVVTHVDYGNAAILAQGNAAWVTGNTTTPPTTGEILLALGTGDWITAAQLSATTGWGGVALPTIPGEAPTAEAVYTYFTADNRADAFKAAGFSTLTAQQVWEYAERTLTAFTFQPVVGGYATGQDPKTLMEAAGSKLTVLYADWLDGGRLDVLLDGITDNLGKVPKAGRIHHYRNTDTDAEATVEISDVG